MEGHGSIKGEFLIGPSDFEERMVISARGFWALFSIAILGNFIFGFIVYYAFPSGPPNFLMGNPFIGSRLQSYNQFGTISWCFYMGSFFSVFLVPAVFWQLGKRRLLPKRVGRSWGQVLKSMAVMFGLGVIFLGSHFSPITNHDGELHGYSIVFAFPFFPVVSGVVSFFLTFPSLQMLALVQKKG